MLFSQRETLGSCLDGCFRGGDTATATTKAPHCLSSSSRALFVISGCGLRHRMFLLLLLFSLFAPLGFTPPACLSTPSPYAYLSLSLLRLLSALSAELIAADIDGHLLHDDNKSDNSDCHADGSVALPNHLRGRCVCPTRPAAAMTTHGDGLAAAFSLPPTHSTVSPTHSVALATFFAFLFSATRRATE